MSAENIRDLVESTLRTNKTSFQFFPDFIMIFVVLRILRVYAPIITLPFAAAIGFAGYQLESRFSTKYKSAQITKSVEDKRVERMAKEASENENFTVHSLKEKKFVPSTVFEKNISPSLTD